MENHPQKPEFTSKQNKLLLPILALSVEVAAGLLFLLGGVLQIASGLVPLFATLLLFSGLVIAIAGLGNGKKEIGKLGLVISIIAIVIPLIPVLAIIVFFIGASTGIIALM